jgi:hypothetical protein
MPQASHRQALIENLRRIFDSLYAAKQITRSDRLKLERIFLDSSLMSHLVTHLYGPEREVVVPGQEDAKLVLLSVKEPGRKRSDLLVFQRTDQAPTRKRTIRCLVGHRFTPLIEASFRYNLRQLCELFGIEEEYSGFDGEAVEVIADLREKIRTYDFCLFDNRETTTPSKPNVYIEAGMAFAFQRPFIFCHYQREVWPADFSNLSYISYKSYKELFQFLSARLPIFLATKLHPQP